ncbi:MAG: YgiQ family radical SAM protein [Tenuifilaceae bacterium]|nr:YgiQ family radical SAM protein [Tenuifilaceae bacterium]
MATPSSSAFLPTSKKEMDALGWTQADIILFTGDAYIDHPSFGAAVVGRVLESAGYKVAIVPQPNWRDDLRDFRKLGVPRLFFAVTSGNMDSMVNHYTANKRLRSDDAYTAGGQSGFRPDYAVQVYSQIIKKIYPEIPLVIGGVEASLRRLTYYDYWADKLMPSILCDSKADMLIYGMGEKPIMQLAQRLNKGELIGSITDLPQTVFLTSNTYPDDSKSITLHSYNDCLKNPSKLGDNFRIIEEESNKMIPCRLIEPYGESSIVVNPPYPIATPNEMDAWWDLPYVRAPHARYKGKKIPAWEMIKFSVNIHRGCFGGCSFCTISAHQGKFVSSRSEKSILKEVDRITKDPEFKGYLSDLGGPSANMYMMQGKNLSICAKCKKPSCIYPSICSNLNTNHEPLLKLYQKVRSIPKVKKAFIGSGIRYDLFADWSNPVNRQYFDDVVRFHVSGRLKVAPEHTEDTVLKYMRKPSFKLFEELKVKFDTINRKFSLNQQLIPYFISSHPGCTLEHMNSLAKRMEKMRIHPEQVQDFTPTPMTLASTIFYTGIDPYTGKPVFVERSKEGKLKQRENFFWYKKSPAKRFESGKRGNIPYRKRKA